MSETFGTALRLIAERDAEFISIILLSLRVSLGASLIAFLIGMPIAAALATHRFLFRQSILILANAFQGLPPVVIGLVVYLLLSRSGPLGALGLLFTPSGMVIAQILLTLPIVVALAHRQFEASWREIGDQLVIDGAGFLVSARMLAAVNRPALATVFLSAFGRAIAEVGAIIIVGGNIRGYTRTMTTAIALETSKGELSLALALGIVLIAMTVAVSLLALALARTRA